MKVSISWLKELVDLKVPVEELIRLFPLRTIGLKEVSDSYIELDMKGYNRADLLSLRGIAFESAAITDSKVSFTEEEPVFPETETVNVEITDETLCPVYCVAKIENLKVENSNETWVKKLNDSGIRSVNNIADVTNLVMVEYGQPLHAFDADTVEDETIVVRTAKAGEKLITLDNKERDLTEEDLLIADPKKAIGLAGVMGGKNTEVSDSTSTILLEAAIFDPKTLRKTATKLGLISEASKRFYHGLTKKRLLQAFSAAIKMYESLGGKVTAITLTGNLKDEVKTIKINQQKINSLIGVDISEEQIKSSLEKLGFVLSKHPGGEEMRLHPRGGAWKTTVPYWRLDINIEEDVIEEIARMYGYEKIPAKQLSPNIPTHPQTDIFGLIERLKKALSGLGLTEVQTYSYYSTQIMSNVKLQMSNLIKIANPISSETEYLRENNWPNLVEVAAKNVRQGFDDIAIFEIGKIYYRNEKEEADEKYSLSIALMNNTDNPIAELSVILNKVKDLSIHLRPTSVGDSSLIAQNDISTLFHPNRFIKLSDGFLAEVHKRVTDKFGISQRVAILEIGIISKA
ncbi:phenylalanine--tRNA ligase subunit beta [Candidatus Daviesbacteria bacterium]|nr:phenylalanine--tRNA ligase subunit beta [Candidatus Daviesbacteria bacterium]